MGLLGEEPGEGALVSAAAVGGVILGCVAGYAVGIALVKLIERRWRR